MIGSVRAFGCGMLAALALIGAALAVGCPREVIEFLGGVATIALLYGATRE